MKSQVPIAIIVAGLIIAGAVLYNPQETIVTEESVIPTKGAVLPVTWGDLGKKLVDAGVIDEVKLTSLYQERGELTPEDEKLLSGQNEGRLTITPYNASHFLNLFWALGLANKNEILDSGEMTDKAYGGAQGFASTGGWTLAKGQPMDHYSRHPFIVLTLEQQVLVDKVSRGIYRPCCNNSTHFPDCNHGMAMLGLLELAASQGVGEEEMYRMALAVNSYWFPDTYLTIAEYLKKKGMAWNKVSAREILGFDYSSASGYKKIVSQVESPVQKGDGGCSV
jgi:hypothetical protein